MNLQKSRINYIPLTKESMAIYIYINSKIDGDYTSITMETNQRDKIDYLEKEHELIHNATQPLTERGSKHPFTKITMGWDNLPKPFQGMDGIDMTLALIAESIFGCPYYCDGPIIRISQIIGEDGFEDFPDDDRIDDCFRKLYSIRHKKEMMREEARIHILTYLNRYAQTQESCGSKQRFAMEMIKRFLDRMTASDIWINLDELTEEMMPLGERDLCYKLLEALDE